MSEPTPKSGFLLGPDGATVLVEHVIGTEETYTFHFRRASDGQAADFDSGGPWTITARVRANAYDSGGILLTKALVNVSGDEADLVIAAADLASVTWDTGERLKELIFDIEVDENGTVRPVRNGDGETLSTFRLLQSAAGTPS